MSERAASCGDPDVRRRVLDGVRALTEVWGVEILGEVESPLPGPTGNLEVSDIRLAT